MYRLDRFVEIKVVFLDVGRVVGRKRLVFSFFLGELVFGI